MIREALIASLLLFTVAVNGCSNHQVHIALGDYYHTFNSADSIINVFFHTNKNLCPDNYVLLYLDNGTQRKIPATATQYQASYSKGDYQTFVHSAQITDIKFDAQYKYAIYNSEKKTLEGPFMFRAPNPQPSARQRNFILYGDLDSSEDGTQSIEYIKKIANDHSKPIDAIFHIGDLAYDLEKKAGKRGDDFMEAIQDIAANVPYMVTMGNHETMNNFSNFNMRFQMPNFKSSQNHFYSVNIDNVHFVSIDLELPVLQPELLVNVANWLEKDLKEANANRAQRPWIIVYSHRPIYCSDMTERDDCAQNSVRFSSIEDLLYKYAVDLYFSGHVHVYERNFPVHKGQVMTYTNPMLSDVGNHYIQDPQAPMYIVEGIPGHDDYPAGKPLYAVKNFCAKLDRDYSIGMISVQNNTHLLWQMIHTSDGSVGDYVYLIKTQNAYSPNTFSSFLEEDEEVIVSMSVSESSSESYKFYLIGLSVVCLLAVAYFSLIKRSRNIEINTELSMEIAN